VGLGLVLSAVDVSRVVSPVVVAVVGRTQRIEIFLLSPLHLDVVVESTATCSPAMTRCHDDDHQDDDDDDGQ